MQQPERDKIVLSVRGDENMRLLIDAGARQRQILQQTKMSFENPAEPHDVYCMLLPQVSHRRQDRGDRAAELGAPCNG